MAARGRGTTLKPMLAAPRSSLRWLRSGSRHTEAVNSAIQLGRQESLAGLLGMATWRLEEAARSEGGGGYACARRRCDGLRSQAIPAPSTRPNIRWLARKPAPLTRFMAGSVSYTHLTLPTKA